MASLGTPEVVHLLLAALPEPAFVMDVQGRFVALNQATADFLGLADPALAIGKTDADFLPPDVAAAFVAEEQHVLATGQPLRNQLVHVPELTEPERWFLVTKAPMRDQAGQIIGLIGTAKDVTTERKTTGAALQAAEERYRRLVEEIPVIAYTQEPGINGALTYSGPQMESILGYTAAEWAMLPNGWLDRLHPDDRDRVMALLTAPGADESFVCDYRLQRRDGRWVWLHDEAVLVRDAAGAPVHWQGVLTDITEQRESLAALQASEARFRAIWEATSDAIALSDPNGIVLAVNPAYCALHGYSESALVGQSFAMVFPPAQRPEVDAVYRAAFAAPGPPLAHEARIQRSDGTFRETEARGAFVEQDGVRVAMITTIRDITERKRIEAELRKAENRYRRLVEEIPVIAYTQKPLFNGSVIYASPQVEPILGYPPAEWTVLASNWLDLLHPEDRARVMVALDEGEATDVFACEYRLRARDGHWVWLQDEAVRVRDAAGQPVHWQGVLTDITVRKRIAAELHAAEERFRGAFEVAPIGMALVTPDGRFLQVNPSQCEILGYSEDELLRKTFQELTHPDDLAADLALLDQLLAGEIASYQSEKRFVRRDDRIIWAQLAVSLVRDHQGAPWYLVGQLEDVTPRKVAEAELREALARLEASNWKLEASNRQLEYQNETKTAFVSVISHEFRTPLTSIQGFSELIADEVETLPEAQVFARTINRNAVRLSRLVHDVLDLDSMAAGQITMVVQPLDLNAIVTTTLETLGPTAGHQLEVRLAPALPAVHGDPDRLVQVVTNLVANAIKYAPAGGSILVTTRPHPEGIELTLADQGLGVPAEHRESIFDPYGRIARPEQSMIDGTGLGLPITKQIVTLHGGRVWVEPNTPQGSVFHVVLPAINNPGAGGQADAAAAVFSVARPAAGPATTRSGHAAALGPAWMG